jgi:hypothetical protein
MTRQPIDSAGLGSGCLPRHELSAILCVLRDDQPATMILALRLEGRRRLQPIVDVSPMRAINDAVHDQSRDVHMKANVAMAHAQQFSRANCMDPLANLPSSQ